VGVAPFKTLEISPALLCWVLIRVFIYIHLCVCALHLIFFRLAGEENYARDYVCEACSLSLRYASGARALLWVVAVVVAAQRLHTRPFIFSDGSALRTQGRRPRRNNAPGICAAQHMADPFIPNTSFIHVPKGVRERHSL
jgi:hypothetical protein